MRTYRQWLEYQELELILTPRLELKRRRRTVLSVLRSIGNSLLAALGKESQLQLWQTVEPNGNVCWNGYDPKTRQSIQLATEEELRVWIDELFSRQQIYNDWDPMLYCCPYLTSRHWQAGCVAKNGVVG